MIRNNPLYTPCKYHFRDFKLLFYFNFESKKYFYPSEPYRYLFNVFDTSSTPNYIGRLKQFPFKSQSYCLDLIVKSSLYFLLFNLHPFGFFDIDRLNDEGMPEKF